MGYDNDFRNAEDYLRALYSPCHDEKLSALNDADGFIQHLTDANKRREIMQAVSRACFDHHDEIRGAGIACYGRAVGEDRFAMIRASREEMAEAIAMFKDRALRDGSNNAKLAAMESLRLMAQEKPEMRREVFDVCYAISCETQGSFLHHIAKGIAQEEFGVAGRMRHAAYRTADMVHGLVERVKRGQFRQLLVK